MATEVNKDQVHTTGPVFNPDGSVRSHTGGEVRTIAPVTLSRYGTYPGDPRNPNDPDFPGTAAGPEVGVVVNVGDQKLTGAGTPQMTAAQPVGGVTSPEAVNTNAEAGKVAINKGELKTIEEAQGPVASFKATLDALVKDHTITADTAGIVKHALDNGKADLEPAILANAKAEAKPVVKV